MGTFNTYGEKSKKYGGAYPVWLMVSQKERGGGVLETLPKAGTVLRAGSLVNIDRAGGTAKIIETFEVAQNVAVSDTEILLRAYSSHPKPMEGMNLMLMRVSATIDAAGTGFAISSVVHDETNGLYKLTVAANTFGTLTAGDILVKASKAGSGAKIYAVPTGLTENDVWIEDGDKYATVASVYHGEIMEDRIQPIPYCVKGVLPMIKFVKGV